MGRAATFSDFRTHARALLAARVPPREFNWNDETSAQESLLFNRTSVLPGRDTGDRYTISPRTLKWMNIVALHSDPRRWQLLYSLLWRSKFENRNVFANSADHEVLAADRMAKQVKRDIHKMHAFVRFKSLTDAEGTERFVAWYEPDHHIVRAVSPFFVERFRQMQWSILTPRECVHWNEATLEFTEGAPVPTVLPKDSIEEWWLAYYSSIFNPARVKTKMMKREMPVRFWKLLPEAAAIPTLLNDAPARLEMMRTRALDRATPPADASLDELRVAARSCMACPLAHGTTQTVFGEGARSRLMLVGEQPGDEEDSAGQPFVGPAGRVLHDLLQRAGIEVHQFYLTNAVKHFKFEMRGKRRLHKRPDGPEILACKPWLQAEIRAVDPEMIVCLGATAAQSVLGRQLRVEKSLGKVFRVLIEGRDRHVLVTYHPSAVLRAATAVQADDVRAAISDCFGRVGELLTRLAGAP